MKRLNYALMALLLVATAGVLLSADGNPVGKKQDYIVKAIERRNGQWMITADYVEFLTGKKGARAAIADGYVESGDGLPDDFYLRNRSKKLRTLPLAPDVTIRMYRDASETRSVAPADLRAVLLAAGNHPSMAQPGWYGIDENGFLCAIWIARGCVSRIEQVYTP